MHNALHCRQWRPQKTGTDKFGHVVFTAWRYTRAVYTLSSHVCPSVTRRYCTKKAKRRSRRTIVWDFSFLTPKISAEFQRGHPQGARQMMMMMSRFVERVINCPQTRCRSAEQVGLQMSSERQWGESCGSIRRAAGKLFQMTGPATAKLLIPSVVLVLGTDCIPVPADRRCRLPAMAEIARQSSAKYSWGRLQQAIWDQRTRHISETLLDRH